MYNPFKIYPPNIDGLSLKLVPKNSKVLDLGCGEVRLGELMEKRLRCKVVGVEIDRKKAKTASSKISKIIVGDIEDQNTQNAIFKNGRFDVVFASAILEHLKDPEFVLKILIKSLKTKNSLVIVTLPNIAHWSIRFQLFFGKFNYANSGILDRTHLHLYNLESARKFLKNSNLKIILEDYEIVGFPFIEKICKLFPFLNWLIREKILKIFPRFFAYQFLFLTIKI